MSEALQKKITFDDAQIGSVKLHYAKAGNGDKLMLLLHGFPEFWYSWRHQLADLSDEYTVIAPDLRGYNLSDKPENVSAYSMDKLVDDVTGLINYFNRQSAIIVGHDWGAAIAWSVALRHPEYVQKLIAMQVPPPAAWKKNQSFKQILTSWYMFFFQIPFVPEWLLSFNDYNILAESLKKSAIEKDIFTDEVLAEYKKAWSETDSLKSPLNFYRANFFSRFLSSPAKTGKIKVPTLFIYGEKDKAVLPETVKNIHDFVDAEYDEIRIPTSGHWVQQEASQAVTDSIREFCKE